MPAIDALFDELVKRGGTDLHLAVGQPPLARVRGELAPLRESGLPAKELEEMLLELVTPAQRSRLASELDLELAYAFRDVARFRATLFVKHSGIAACFRLVPARVPTLAELGCPDVLWRLAESRSGLLVVGGPASNGKTTTTAALVDHVNKTRSCHVLTIESPIEFVHEPIRASVTQREVGTHLPSLSAGLRNAARENADVVAVSDLSTREEVELALRLAGEGTAVIANVATSSVALAIDRLVGAFEVEAQPRARARLADALTGVVVQHLIRAADVNGRIPVHEVMIATPAVRAAVRDGSTARLLDAIRSGEGEGMQSLDGALERLVSSRRITRETAFDRAFDKAAFVDPAASALR